MKDLQQAFADYVLEGNLGIASAISSSKADTAQERLAIYRDAYALRLQEVLAKDYPLTRQLIGEKFFKYISLEYISKEKPKEKILLNFSRKFPYYIEQVELLVSSVSYVERAVDVALDAEDKKLLEINGLREIASRGLGDYCFQPHPAIQCLACQSNAFELYWAYLKEETLPALKAQPLQHYLIWRQDLNPIYRPCSQEELLIFQGIKSGLSFAAVCENLLELLPEEAVAPFAVQCLSRWIEEQILVE